MNLRLSALFLAVLVSGCAAPYLPTKPNPMIAERQAYVDTQLPLAEQGKIKWSDYYVGLIDRENRIGAPADHVELVRLLLLSAKQMEEGAISPDEFAYRRQDIKSRIVALAQQRQAQAQAQQQANTALALQLMQRNQFTPYQIPAPSTQANAVRPLQIQQVQPQVAATATAYWTGKQTQVQTVTYQAGWNCEYNYAGRTFWRTFVGTCPTSVQVQ